MKYFFKFLNVVLIFFLIVAAYANPTSDEKKLTVDFQEVNVVDALRIMAKFAHVDMIISPAVTGKISIHLRQESISRALDVIVASQGLAKWKKEGVWYVAPQRELIERQQDEFQMQETLRETAALKTVIWQIHYAKAQDIAHLIQDANYSLLSKRGHLQVDTRTNKLCVQDAPYFLDAILALIKKLDIPVQQVLIEARLASIDSDYERALGMNFGVHDATPESGTVPWSNSTPHYSLAIARLPDGASLDVALTALENDGHGELISSPSLFTANQQSALIESGEEIPYQESSSSGATNIAFKKAVLSLQVTPQIMPNNRVLLQLKVNQDKPNNRIVLGVPSITTRQLTTNILIKNGQTIVLGGIYELDKERDAQRIPFLSKIPLVGLLFQQQNAKEKKRELLIFVTPKIIS